MAVRCPARRVGLLAERHTARRLDRRHQGHAAGQDIPGSRRGGKVVGGYKERQPAAKPSATGFQFSERESEVLKLLAQGLTNVDIAHQLFISEGTVRNYTSDIFKKLGVSDRTQAAIAAIRYGLVELDEF